MQLVYCEYGTEHLWMNIANRHAIEHDVTAAEARSPYTSEASAPAVPAAPQPDEHADARNQ